MATARIAAGLVNAAAVTKQEAIEAMVEAGRLADIEEIRQEPIVSGPFWNRTVKVRSAADAEAEYAERLGFGRTTVWWRSVSRNKGLCKAREIAGLANAALTSGDGYVTLDADEVRFLGLEGK